jgi:D-alanyl-lipoteichoic acid acyltransferase DltB (MBOAT superfamily)
LENEVEAIERDKTHKENLHIITKLMLCFALCIFTFPMLSSAAKYVTKKFINKKAPQKSMITSAAHEKQLKNRSM